MTDNETLLSHECTTEIQRQVNNVIIRGEPQSLVTHKQHGTARHGTEQHRTEHYQRIQLRW